LKGSEVLCAVGGVEAADGFLLSSSLGIDELLWRAMDLLRSYRYQEKA
jgi:hypothetical protein